MNTQNETKQPFNTTGLIKPVLIGAVLGFIVISYFLIGLKEANPEWGKLWFIRPLLVVPFAGACAGVFYFLMGKLRAKGGWEKTIANAASFLVLFIGLWMGIVLGLNGTMWN